MMHTMDYNQGWQSGMDTLGGLHVLGVLALMVGIIFLIVWAVKTLTVPQLRLWGIGALIVGVVLCLLSLVATPRFSVTSFDNGTPMRIQSARMVNGMMDTNGTVTITKAAAGMGDGMGDIQMQNMMPGMAVAGETSAMSMSMDDMAAMLRGKTGDAFDQAFIEGMIPHHQGAIDMARAALKSAAHPELKELARQIISAQQKEIEMMREWNKDWGFAQ